MEDNKNEVLTSDSKLKSTKVSLPFIEGSLSVCKIETYVYDGHFGNRDLSKIYCGSGTGFFIKFRDNKSKNKYKYFIMTNEHVIQKEIIEKGSVYITIYYFYEKYSKKILLNKQERFIKEYKTDFELDISLIEVIPEKEIPVIFFLEPDYKSLNGFHQYMNEEIIIHQYPKGLEQCNSEGKIININNKVLTHTASTQGGSSGSPIILKNNSSVIGIHKSGATVLKENYGDFICDVINDVNKAENIKSYEEKDKIENRNNYTNTNVIIEKTDKSRKYLIHPYEILIKINNNKFINISITNINTEKVFYQDDLIYDNIDKEINIFDKEIYKAIIKERDDDLIFELNDERIYKLKSGNNKKLFNNSNNYITAEVMLDLFKDFLHNDDIGKKRNNYHICDINKFKQDTFWKKVIINPFEEYKIAKKDEYPYNPKDFINLIFFHRSFKEEKEIDKSYNNDLKDICEITINNEIIPFSYTYKFNFGINYSIQYKFKKELIKADYLFYKCPIKKIDLSNLNTQKITSMIKTFSLSYLEYLDLSNIYAENLTDMSYLFFDCLNLKKVNLSNFIANNVLYLKGLFSGCKNLKDINLSNFNTKNVTNMSYMFSECWEIPNINLSNFDLEM